MHYMEPPENKKEQLIYCPFKPLKHHALVEAAQQYEELQLQLQQAQAELAEFHGLPASQVQLHGVFVYGNIGQTNGGCYLRSQKDS
eukprot:1157296-Pelagomonas_calceolata.AAC.13